MEATVHELEGVLRARHEQRPEGSYTATLFADRDLVERKIMEEAFETCLELGKPTVDTERLVSESADLVFHLMVGLTACGVSLEDVFAELGRRRA
ncbi:phosphoribosyl-ATP diphosphatase [Aquihabitans sp. G128]|uniref:phosphoribosyl-ATP diphosphatase n=1 Tax=Aquihabitans sp. G128 TaxID=2849779 RepID=UPI001C23385C|nr:phosphoribosyl-ATP diphosphatase [Aquihabitans sp. G128]QXC60004.1 phosphoribosyl-ATP diphosphatase [Aquihabitans sp. G128]